MRVFETRDVVSMVTLFKALVLPHLEYCSQLWSPSSVGEIRKLEAVQRSFTSRIRSVSSLNYWKRLEELKLYSIERRRERYSIIYVYKIIKGQVPNLNSERFSIVPYETVGRGRKCRVPAINTSSSARIKTMVENSFAIKAVNLFNVLPQKLRDFDGSSECFKHGLNDFLKKSARSANDTKLQSESIQQLDC